MAYGQAAAARTSTSLGAPDAGQPLRRANGANGCEKRSYTARQVYAEFFPKQNDAVPGLHHVARDFPAHLAGAFFDLCKGTTRTFRGVTEAGLKGRGLRLQIDG